MELDGWKMTFRKKKRRLPKAVIEDAKNGIIRIEHNNARKGLYQLVCKSEDNEIVLNVKII